MSVLTNRGLNNPPKGQENAVRESLSRILYGTGDSHQNDDHTDGKDGCETEFLLRCEPDGVQQVQRKRDDW